MTEERVSEPLLDTVHSGFLSEKFCFVKPWKEKSRAAQLFWALGVLT
jgi:hypothetical protein